MKAASMRPRLITAENLGQIGLRHQARAASMRPRLITAENDGSLLQAAFGSRLQ